MATKLLKPVKRELFSTSRKGRTLIVSLEPGDMISFREKGLKKSFNCYIGHCYVLAQIMQADQEYKERMKNYEERKKKGAKGLRKPKKAFLPFSKIYFDAVTK